MGQSVFSIKPLQNLALIKTKAKDDVPWVTISVE